MVEIERGDYHRVVVVGLRDGMHMEPAMRIAQRCTAYEPAVFVVNLDQPCVGEP